MSASATALANGVQLYAGESLPQIAQGDLAQLNQETQAWMADHTSTAATDTRVAAGATAAANLIANGYNPNNDADNGQLVASIAGGVSLIVPIGTIIGAAIEGLWQLGTNVVAPLVDKIFGYSSTPACTSSGNWTPQGILKTYGNTAAFPPTGTLAGLVVPALFKGYADQMNCLAFNNAKGAVPYGYYVMLGPLLKIWNHVAGGELIDYFVPKINAYDWPTFGFSGSCWAGPICNWWQMPYAFQPLSAVPQFDNNGQRVAHPLDEGSTWIRVAANAGPLTAQSSNIASQRHVITLRLPLKQQVAAVTTASATSLVLKSAAVAGGIGLAATAVYAHVEGLSFMGVLRGFWTDMKRMI